MADEAWQAVDDYILAHVGGNDAVLQAVLAANRAAGLPAIDVSAAQGKLLHLLARMARTERILEVGTLGGYSTIWLARALAPHGRVTTIEADPHHAATARANFAAAALADRIELREGRAIDVLPTLTAPFDLAFIDADKPSNADYFDWALRLSRPGGVIVVDNIVRGGKLIDAGGDANVQGARRLFDRIATEPRVSATALQTVGHKGWDGLAIAVVN